MKTVQEYEASIRQRIHEHHPETRLDFETHQWQPSHFHQAGRQERIVSPVHGNQPLKTGLLKYQMKIAGLTGADL